MNGSDTKGFTPLMYAARNGDMEVVEKFISKGARVNPKDNTLKEAAGNGHVEVVKRLLEIGMLFFFFFVHLKLFLFIYTIEGCYEKRSELNDPAFEAACGQN